MYVRSILRDSFHFYIGNIKQIALLCAPILSVAVLSQYLLFTIPEFDAAPFISPVLGLLFYPVYTAAFILLIAKRTGHEYPSNFNLLAASLKIWAPFILLTLMVGILIGIGFILFILPGIWVAVRLSFSEIFMVVGELKPIDAMSASFEATKEYFWIILISMFCVTLPIWAINFGLERTKELIEGSYVINFTIDVVIAFISLFINVAIFRIFMLVGIEQANLE